MRNRALNTLKYTGIVTLSQYMNSKKIKIAQVHNKGGDSLFDFLANCLVGDFTMARVTRPTKIMLIEQTSLGDNPTYRKPNESVGFRYLLTKPEKVYIPSGASVVRYSFLIPKEELDSLPSFDNIFIGLYHESASEDAPGEFAAVCELGITKTSLVNASLVVDWELAISNGISNYAK